MLGRMHSTPRTLLVLSLIAVTLIGAGAATIAPAWGPQYTTDGRLALPSDYRRWVFLSSGFDMSYQPGPSTNDHHMFDNVFADPRSYAAFMKTGHWPDKTMLVLESREAQGKAQ
jgi:hypothetical protein